MARPKRNSSILPVAEKRLVGMKSIDPKLNLGGGCTTTSVEKQINTVRQKLQTYHTLLAQADAAADELESEEKVLSNLSKKVLKGVAVMYDEESREYTLVGGIRPSERKRARRPASATPAMA